MDINVLLKYIKNTWKKKRSLYA